MSKPSKLAVTISEQQWLPYRTRRAVLKWIAPAMLKDFAFERDFFGMKFRGNIVNYIDRLVYFCGAHEKYMLHFLRDIAGRMSPEDRASLTFFDIGANAGNHSLFMAKYAKAVYAFEPFERVRNQLLENIAVNRIENIRVLPFGLGDQNAELPFYSGPDSNLGSSSFYADHRSENRLLGNLTIRAGDEVVAELGNPRVDIVKADVEGFEKHVLAGLKNTLVRSRPILIVELSAKTRETIPSQAALEALLPPDYRYYYFAVGKRDSGRYSLAPFSYDRLSKIEDVIAVPKEKLEWLLKE